MAIKSFDADGIHYISDKGHRGNIKSLKNLMAPFGSEERPFKEISKRAHSEEANKKRSETLKKKHAAKKEAKYVAEVTEEVCKRVLERKLTQTQLKNLDINEILTDEEKENISFRQAMNLKVALMTLYSNDLKDVVKGAEYMANYAGEKPAERTDISVMAESASGVELLTKALMEDDEAEDDE